MVVCRSAKEAISELTLYFKINKMERRVMKNENKLGVYMRGAFSLAVWYLAFQALW